MTMVSAAAQAPALVESVSAQMSRGASDFRLPDPPLGQKPGPIHSTPDGDGPFQPIDVRLHESPQTDDDITVDRWGMCGSTMGVNVGTGDGDDEINLRINEDGSSDLWVNGEYKGHFNEEDTSLLTIDTGEGADKVTIEDNRSFQDAPLPSVFNSGRQGTDQVRVLYPGALPAEFPLEPGQRSV